MAVDPKDLPRHYYTPEEYSALERVGDARYEYWNGEIVCMSGGTPQHAIIGSNLQMNISRQIAGRNCRIFSADLAIKTPSLPPYRYPDLSVVCGPPIFEDANGIAILTNPILLVEVLSPDSENRDRNEKRHAYQALPSLREYLIVEQKTPHLTHYLKENDQWSRKDYAELKTVIELPSIGCRLSLADVYEGVAFD